MLWWARLPPRFRVDVARAGNISVAMSFMATHLKLNREAETFSVSGKTPQPNQESLYSAIHAKRMPAYFSLTIENAA